MLDPKNPRNRPHAWQALGAAFDALPYGNLDVSPWQFATARALVLGYHAAWYLDTLHNYDVVSVEETIHQPIRNPRTNHPARVFSQAGKCDVIARHQGRLVIVDHKTASASYKIDDPADPYWKQLLVDTQSTHYLAILEEAGRPVEGAVWDVLKKPSFRRRKKLLKAWRHTALMCGNDGGLPLSDYSLRHLKQHTSDTPETFENRLIHEVLLKPDLYYARRAVTRLRDDLDEYRRDLWRYQKELLWARKHGPLPPKNPHSCYDYQVPCRYLDVCCGMDEIARPRWTFLHSVHQELPEVRGETRDIITHSRLKTLRACPRKHYYRYELGAELSDGPSHSEALQLGTMVHACLEAWWRSFMIEEEVGNGEKQLALTD